MAVGLSVLFSSDSELQQPATAEVGEDTLFDSIDTVPADKPPSPPSVNVASSAVSSKFCCTDMGACIDCNLINLHQADNYLAKYLVHDIHLMGGSWRVESTAPLEFV